jgi:hypothetical protein
MLVTADNASELTIRSEYQADTISSENPDTVNLHTPCNLTDYRMRKPWNFNPKLEAGKSFFNDTVYGVRCRHELEGSCHTA